MKIGLYFGSFNPVHNGHLIIANKMLETARFDEVWFIPSPQNPFKESKDLLDFSCRMQMLEAVLNNEPYIKVIPIENKLPKPSYTIQTIKVLEKDYPNYHFDIIIGSDNLKNLHLWKEINEILKRCTFHVYHRRGENDKNEFIKKNIIFYNLPFIEISSTSIRKSIKKQKSILGEVDSKINSLIQQNRWYF